MRTRNKTVFLLFAGFLTLSQAQESPFKSFIIALWPDYDKPGVLVILTGEIEKDKLPLRIKPPIPLGADFVLGPGHAGGTPDLSPLNEINSEKGRLIDDLFIKPQFQIEFYYNPFDKKENRESEYTFELNHLLNSYHVAIQIPLASDQFIFSESDIDSVRDDHGLKYIRKRFDLLPPNSPQTFSFSYFNKNERLTVDVLQEMLDVMPSKDLAIDENKYAVERYRLPKYQPYVILAFVVIAISIVFFNSEKKELKPTEKNKKNFCTKCGEKIKYQNNFCSNCGKPLI